MKYLSVKPLILLAFAWPLLLSSCTDDSIPEAENEEESITDIILTFTPAAGGETVMAVASDPDGEGPEERIVEDIVLAPNTTYILNIGLENALAGTSITEEVEEEAGEHVFLFSWTEGIFTNPTGDGNTDNRNDALNYLDMDSNSLPLGLETSWTTGDPATGTFRLVLKHQPGSKTVSSGINVGETDADVSWPVLIAE